MSLLSIAEKSHEILMFMLLNKDFYWYLFLILNFKANVLYLNFLSWFLQFGSNSSVVSNSGIDVHDLSWVFLSQRLSPLASMYFTGHAQTLLYGL